MASDKLSDKHSNGKLSDKHLDKHATAHADKHATAHANKCSFKEHVGFPIRCQRFYADDANMRRVLNAIQTVSLRSLEWFVLNFAKKHDVVYDLDLGNGRTTQFNVFLEYRAQLASFGKKYFDLFCRKTEDVVVCDGVKTTAAQLNAMCWVFTHGVMDEFQRRIKDVERDMRDTLRERRTTGVIKRKELTKAQIRTCLVRSGKIRVNFE